MQNVSESWKTAQQQNIAPEAFVEVSYQSIDMDAQESCHAADDGDGASYSKVTQITDIDSDATAYAMIEHNMWVLDGNADIIPDDLTNEHIGFVSNHPANEYGWWSPAFPAMEPVISLSWNPARAILASGITIQWGQVYGEVASKFEVRIGSETIYQASGNTDVVTYINYPIDQSVSEITIIVSAWQFPLHRCRIEKVYIGAYKIFDKKDITEYTHVMDADILSSRIPKSSITFKVNNSNEYWNPENPAGGAKYLEERQRVDARYGFKLNNTIEWIPAGTFWLSEWDTPTNGITASFAARDLFGLMDEKYAGRNTGTLYEIATDAFLQCDIPLKGNGDARYSIDASLSSISVTNADLGIMTCAEVVQLCANAAKCVIRIHRTGDVSIVPYVNVLTDYEIDPFLSYANAEISLSKELKSVDVNDGLGAAANASVGEIQEVNNVLIQTAAVANGVAEWVKNVLKHRKTLSGEYRADPRADALDKITTTNKYGSGTPVISYLKYTFSGAFKGYYEGRVHT